MSQWDKVQMVTMLLLRFFLECGGGNLWHPTFLVMTLYRQLCHSRHYLYRYVPCKDLVLTQIIYIQKMPPQKKEGKQSPHQQQRDVMKQEPVCLCKCVGYMLSFHYVEVSLSLFYKQCLNLLTGNYDFMDSFFIFIVLSSFKMSSDTYS